MDPSNEYDLCATVLAMLLHYSQNRQEVLIWSLERKGRVC